MDWVAKTGTVFRAQYQKAILYMHVYALIRCIPEAMLFHPKYGNILFSLFLFFSNSLSFLFLRAQHRVEYREMAQ